MSTIPLSEPDPDSSWSLEQLKPRITQENNSVESYRRKTAIHTYRLGRLLTLAKSQIPHGEWAKFLEEMGISIATDNRARTLFDLIDSEDELKGLTITEAYEKAGISIGSKTKAETAQAKAQEPAPPLKLQPFDEGATDGSTEVTDQTDEGGSDDDDDDQSKVSDDLIESLTIMANELESFAADALPQISSDEREQIRIALQKVSTAHQKLLDAFFNAVEAA